VRKCPPCASYEELGKDLRSARYLALGAIPPVPSDLAQSKGRWSDALACLGLAAGVGERPAVSLPSNVMRQVVLALTDDAVADLSPTSRQAIGRRFLVNTTPLDRGKRIRTFEELAEDSQGIKRLGVLRMDVDGLGKLFSEGFKSGKTGENRATLSRVASLSFAISLYFEGWVEKLAEDYPGDRLYAIYSGGDDLFFVGAWDAVVDFACQVRSQLTPYAAGHPGIHTSAGIVLVGGKYPLSQAARDAEEAEQAAKSFRRHDTGRGKDAVSFLSQVQPWDRFGLEDEPDSVKALAQLLRRLTQSPDEDHGAPTALVQNLARLYDQYADAEQIRRESGRDRNQAGEPQPMWGPWMWRGYHMLTRMADRTNNREITEAIRDLRDQLQQTEFRNMAWIGLAARWAELLHRAR
jgi:CRISPR-associated protein Csm1